MKRVTLWFLGVLVLVLAWRFYSADMSVWINEEQVTGPLASLAGGGISLLAAFILLGVALAVMFLFAGIGLFMFSIFVVMIFPWLFPILIPVGVVLALIGLIRGRQKKLGDTECHST